MQLLLILAALVLLIVLWLVLTAALCGAAVNAGARLGVPVATPVEGEELRSLRYLSILCLLASVAIAGALVAAHGGEPVQLAVAAGSGLTCFVLAMAFVCVKILPATDGGSLTFVQALPLPLLIGAAHAIAGVAIYAAAMVLLVN